jgi:hypothetical protein
MEVVAFRQTLTSDCAEWIESFIHTMDPRIRGKVDEEQHGGLLWPGPPLQLDPSFVPVPTVDNLVHQRLPHPSCAQTFRFKEPGKEAQP